MQESDIILALRGEGEVVRGLGATTAAVKGLRDAVLESGAAMDVQRRRSFLMNQALFTARRFLYAGTLALGGFTAGALYMGIKFNMTMENNRVALTQFLGSTQAAQTELNKLYDVAAKTPFEFSNIVDATRRFLAFGFTLQQTNRYLSIMGDTAAAFGGSADQIQRLVLVFGQMRAAGRVLGQDLLQLEQIGVPALQILQEQLGLTRDQMANIGRLHIPADIAIEALMRGLDQRFHGMSEKQAKTLQGRLSTLHDYAARMMGTLTLPLYNRLRDKIIPDLTDLANQMQSAAQGGGIRGALKVVDDKYGTSLVRIFNLLASSGRDFWLVLKNDLIPVVVFLYKTFQPLIVVLTFVATGLHLLAHGGLITKIVIYALIIEFVRLRLLLIAFGGPGGHGGILGMVGRGIETNRRRMQAWKNMAQLTWFGFARAGTGIRDTWKSMLGAWTVLTKGFIRGSNGQFVAMTRLQRVALTLRNAFLGLAGAEGLAAGGMILIATIAIIVIAGLVILYFRWKRFHNAVNATARFLYSHWYILALIPIVGPMAAVIVIVARNFGTIIHWVRRVITWVQRLVGWIKTAVHWMGKLHVPSLWHFPHVPSFHIPGLAMGGNVVESGYVRVGEHGPEVLSLPQGATVQPIKPQTPVMESWKRAVNDRPIVVQLVVDRKVLAEANARARNDAEARR